MFAERWSRPGLHVRHADTWIGWVTTFDISNSASSTGITMRFSSTCLSVTDSSTSAIR